MNFMGRKILLIGALVPVLFLVACATHIKSSSVKNPPPSEAFANFTAFEMKPAALAPAFENNEANQRALAKIQENLSAGMTPSLNKWNQVGATKAGAERTLVIESVVTDIKFIAGAVRFFVGPIAGSSAIVMRATITEKENGKVVAAPEFYAVGGTWKGSFTMGVTDNLMLTRVAGELRDYLIANYASAIGGPTGARRR